MAAHPLPAAFALLEGEHNLAVDEALAEILPHADPAAQEAALGILVKRARPTGLSAVVRRFGELDDRLQRSLVARAAELSAGVRTEIVSPTFAHRAGAIELIVRSDAGALAYLLADALRSRCTRTCALAAQGLSDLATRWQDRCAARPCPVDAGALGVQADYLAEAMASAVRRFETHHQSCVLAAALRFGGRVDSAIREQLAQPRTTIAKPLAALLEDASDPRLAGAVIRALAIPALRRAAAKAVTRARAGDFLRALLAESWLAVDSDVEAGCRRVVAGAWTRDALSLLDESDAPDAGCAVRFLLLVGGTETQRRELRHRLIGSSNPAVRRATVWCLVRDTSALATELLTVLAARPGDSAAAWAKREVRRRRKPTGGAAASDARGAASDEGARFRRVLAQFWEGFDELRGDERSNLVRAARGDVRATCIFLRARLTSAEPLDRARALRMVDALGLASELEDPILLRTRDSDPVVRSLCVTLLAQVRGSTVGRVLRSAVNDPDQRVVANAIEAADRLGLADRVAYTAPRLRSSNVRVRVCAIKSLLREEKCFAAQALIDMLEDPLADQRLGALWLVEHLGLRAVRARVEEASRKDPQQRVRERARRVSEALGLPAPMNYEEVGA